MEHITAFLSAVIVVAIISENHAWASHRMSVRCARCSRCLDERAKSALSDTPWAIGWAMHDILREPD